MLSILPKRIRASASVLLTNSDGNPPPVALLRRFIAFFYGGRIQLYKIHNFFGVEQKWKSGNVGS